MFLKNFLFVKILILLIASNTFSQNVQITERLAAKMKTLNPLQYTGVLILLKDRVDIEEYDRYLYSIDASLQYRSEMVIKILKEKAESTQGSLLEYLNQERQNGKVKQVVNYWVTNLVYAEATTDVLHNLTMRNDIDVMDFDAVLDIDRPYFENPETVENGLKVIKADSLWKKGITGAGRTVMNIDGGVNGTHPALSSRWWGNNGRQWYHSWYDPISPVTTSPFDCATGGIYHGTHTMGIMCGRNTASGDTVGVAPDAYWMAAGITDCPGSSNPSMNIAAFQWAIDPDTNAATLNSPDVISCSWRDPSATNECTNSIYRTTLSAVEAAGIAVVFSAGNSGPGASTITPPKNINIDSVNVFCVGNINGTTLVISNSSSRGPSLCGGTGTLLIKPEVCAPGSSIRSSWSGSSYASISGTSMAAPHVAGCIALLKQAAPNMTGRQIKAVLLSTATDLGAAGEDNTYGKGLINVNRAYMMLTAPVASDFTFTNQGFYEPSTSRNNIRDTFNVYFRNNTSPYNKVDSGKTVIDSVTLSGQVLFSSAVSGTYYIQVKHRNSIETWSKSGGEVYSSGSAFSYNFTSAITQAFGNNMILEGAKYCFYSGDVNQDGVIDGADVVIIDNDASGFVTGYTLSDLNGDGVSDGTDILIAGNNAFNFVMSITP